MDTNNPSTEDKIRTITLTGRAPVKVRDSQWPLVAVASEHDGQVKSQANREWWIRIRQHDDGRMLVYGGYESAFQNEHDLRAGYLLDADHDAKDIADAVYRVADGISAERRLADECIADLPAEEI
jgi:hypothetical protein